MMWYRAHYGNWAEPDGVQYLAGTYSFQDIKERAIEAATRTRKTVIISGEKGSCRGLSATYWAVGPNGDVTRK